MDLNKLNSRKFNIEDEIGGKPGDQERSIAVIGMSAQIGTAQNIEQFWEYLSQGCDMIRDFPSGRIEDADLLHQIWFQSPLPEDPVQAAYLDRVDQFDAELYNIPPIEADCMDPVQRLLLEAAWAAIEDAGYATQALSGEKVSVNIGYGSSDNPYHAAMWNSDKETFGIAVSGNVDAMLAGRVSYLLNLKGPAMVINTACSSSLAAVNIACQQLRDGVASMALVGGIKLILIPPDKNLKLGVEALSGRTRTLDEKADGTGRGEGAICMLLKPYLQAEEDGDHIYALIRGIASNQDGASVGITAPNAKAQEMVIREAWQDAKVAPQTVSYIELHGTATKLGDSAEVTGIEMAFEKFTDKKQFCGVGSVKSNAGHLDGAAGLAGMLKAILMLHKKRMVPSIHFNSPVKSVSLINSPVYLNDRSVSWNPGCGVRRCGVSSFGISGTNCHVVLEEHEDNNYEQLNKSGIYLITASAKSLSGLKQLISEYQEFLLNNPECNLYKFSYTANVGRNHYQWRFAIVIKDICEFIHSDMDQLMGQTGNGFFGHNKVSEEEKGGITKQLNSLLMKSVKKDGTKEYDDILHSVARLYSTGADPDWGLLYGEACPGRISIPGYPFTRSRYWHKFQTGNIWYNRKEVLHPLIDECSLWTEEIQVYTKRMSIDNCWELKEHIINGVHVLPGTAIIEMAREALSHYTKSSNVVLHQLTYHTPVMFQTNDVPRKIKILLVPWQDKISVEIRSKNPGTEHWVSHAVLKGSVVKVKAQEQNIAVKEIVARCHQMNENMEPINRSIVRIDGNHWDNVDAIYGNENELLVHFNMNETIRDELAHYFLHPGMLDPAVNAGSYLTNGTYLPFSFQKAQFLKRLPARFYSWIKRRALSDNSTNEFEVFDISLCCENGSPIGNVDEYVLKKVKNSAIYADTELKAPIFSEIKWIRNDKMKLERKEDRKEGGLIVVLLRKDQLQSKQYLQMKNRFENKTVAVIPGETYKRTAVDEYCIRDNFGDFEMLIQDLGITTIKRVIHMSACRAGIGNDSLYDWIEDDLFQLKRAFFMVKAIYTMGCLQTIDFNILTNYGAAVLPGQTEIFPGNRALIGFGKGIRFEYGNLIVRTIDFDEMTPFCKVLDELLSKSRQYLTAYRNSFRYTESLSGITQMPDKTMDVVLEGNGTYVIAGGLGGIGIELARKMFLVSSDIKIVLLNRRFNDNDVLLQINDKNMQKVCDIKEEGFKLHIVKADITKIKEVERAFELIKSQFGAVKGVIHAAGIAGEGFIVNKEWDNFYNVLAPKVIGGAILHEYTLKMELDFFVTCSSCVSVFGAGGQSDYAAANAYLDGLSEYRKIRGLPALDINWTGWSETGMAADYKANEENSYTFFFDNAAGTDAFMKMLTGNRSQVIAGRLNPEVIKKEKGILKDIITLPDEVLRDDTWPVSINDTFDISGIIIDGTDQEQLDGVEKKVAYAWARALGTKKVDVTVKFFESGGNSLLAAMLHKELDKLFPEQVAITEIFIYSSIEEMAAYLRKKTAEHSRQQPKKDIQEQVDIESFVSKFAKGEFAIDDISKIL